MDQEQDFYSMAEELAPPIICTPERTAYLSLETKQSAEGTLYWAHSGAAVHGKERSVGTFMGYFDSNMNRFVGAGLAA